MSTSYTFYNDVCDPESQSMQLLLTAKQIPHTTVPINDIEKVAGIQNANQTRAESYLDVLKVLEANSESIPDAQQKAILEYFVKNIQPLFYRTVLTGNPREGLDLFFEALSYLENSLIVSCGPYFGGKLPSVLDYGLYPWIEKIGSWIPEINQYECVRLQAWVKLMRNEPVVSKVKPACDMTSFNTYKHSLSLKIEEQV